MTSPSSRCFNLWRMTFRHLHQLELKEVRFLIHWAYFPVLETLLIDCCDPSSVFSPTVPPPYTLTRVAICNIYYEEFSVKIRTALTKAPLQQIDFKFRATLKDMDPLWNILFDHHATLGSFRYEIEDEDGDGPFLKCGSGHRIRGGIPIIYQHLCYRQDHARRGQENKDTHSPVPRYARRSYHDKPLQLQKIYLACALSKHTVRSHPDAKTKTTEMMCKSFPQSQIVLIP